MRHLFKYRYLLLTVAHCVTKTSGTSELYGYTGICKITLHNRYHDLNQVMSCGQEYFCSSFLKSTIHEDNSLNNQLKLIRHCSTFSSQNVNLLIANDD